jgi:predicted RNA-binding protein associated with RNAse of E/G family
MDAPAALPIIASGDWQHQPDLFDYRFDWRNDILVERATWADAAAVQRLGHTIVAAPGFVWFRFWIGEGDHILDKYFDDSGAPIGIYAYVGMGLPHQGRGYSIVDLMLGLWITGQSHVTVHNEGKFDAAVADGLISPVDAEHAEHRLREMTTAIAYKRFPPALVRNFAIVPK